MKRKEKDLEDILRLPPGSQEEMGHALDRVMGRLRSNTALNHDPLPEKPSRGGRWPATRTAMLVAATFLVAFVLAGVVWNSRVYGTLQTSDSRSRWIYSETTFGDAGGVLTLRDASRVEIRPLSVVSLQRAADGVRIRLDQGTIIVNAAQQRSGHLYVQTKDMTVSVVGTVFVVNARETGSRVAVLQGEVQVQHGPTEKQLRSGEQASTSPGMEMPPVKEDVSWSLHAAEHLALLDHGRTVETKGPDAFPEPEWQKAAGSKMSFESASVQPSNSRDPGPFPLFVDNIYRSTGGVYKASFPLRYYIEFAYKLSLTPQQRESWLSQVPTWVETEHFAIDAKAAIRNPTKDQMRLMMQSLLAEHFKLALHFETKQMPVLALTFPKSGKLGPQIRPHAEGPPCPAKRAESDLFPRDFDPSVWPHVCGTVIHIRPRGVSLERLGPEVNKSSMLSHLVAGRNVSMEIMLDSFMRLGIGMDRPLVDQTGLKGNFDFSFEWTPAPESTANTFPPAVEEQLGMSVEETRAPVPVLVVDHVEKPTEN
jgi:uncharacterized protein (TIGR03435 family)